jgi:hypothetical protein
MPARSPPRGVREAGKQDGAGPVIDHTVAAYGIEMCADDDFVRLSPVPGTSQMRFGSFEPFTVWWRIDSSWQPVSSKEAARRYPFIDKSRQTPGAINNESQYETNDGGFNPPEVPARLVLFPDEWHWIMKGENSRKHMDEVLAWLKQWL